MTKLTEKELKEKWIENACDYLGNKTRNQQSFKFNSGTETNGYSGRSFHEQIAEPYVRGVYKWCAVNINNNFVVFYCGEREAQTYLKSKFNNDPPAACITLDECKCSDISKDDKALLDKIYDEMCLRIHGMNEHITRMYIQCEKEFEIQRESETMFEFLESTEEKKEEPEDNVKSDE